MNISKGKKKYLRLAKRVAADSDHDHFKHGAVLVKGGSVINVACNKGNYRAFGDRFRNTQRLGHATSHAELACILGLDRAITQGTTMYVVRTNRNGTFRMSKPCEMCARILKHCGVRRVVYTTGLSSRVALQKL